MLRITQHNQATHRQLTLSGRIMGPWVTELRLVCEAMLREGSKPLVLDLAHVGYVDHSGIQLLLTLRGACVRFERSSMFLEQLLSAATTCSEDKGETCPSM